MINCTQFSAGIDKSQFVMNEQVQPSDEKLVLACRQGDAGAWALLIHRFQRLIYTIPRRAGLNEDQAAEVFQGTFSNLLAKLNDVEHPARIRAWLVTTARHETIRLMREHRAKQSEGKLEAVSDGELLPTETLKCLEEQHRIRTALAALDERCRQLLTVLFYRTDPLPDAEVAAALDVRESSLGLRRARCLRRLHRLLDYDHIG